MVSVAHVFWSHIMYMFLLVVSEGELFSEQRAFEGDDIGCAGVGERDSV